MSSTATDSTDSYPHQWEADVVLSDGGVVHLRPVRAADAPELAAMHRRMSARTKYLRYFGAVDEVSDQLLRVYLDVDHRRIVCLVAELGEELIAAGTYHACGVGAGSAASAEVAFVVVDDHQGRGIGSILLEHLAAAAQENDIGSFTAEALGENRGMVNVFLDAGYTVRREYSTGVVDLAFDIAPTEQSRAVQISREQRAESRSIARLLAPRSIAVIGASTEPSKLGHAVLVNLLAGPFRGPVYPVNPEAVAVQGVRAYPTVTDIPGEVDVAVVTVPAATVAEVVDDCRRKGVHGLVVVTAGFADADTAGLATGADAQRQMVAVARANGMRVLGPNCLGMVNTDPSVQMNATLAPIVPPHGRIGFFCQSGALGIAVLADAAARGLGLSSFVSAGNRADVSGNDLLQFWQTDDRTDVVLLYLESFGNPRKFARLARALARTKPVIVVKSGRHAMVTPGLAASSSALSTAAVATLFAQSGVIRTDDLAHAFDVAALLTTQPLPTGRRVAIVGNSTALGVLAADACLDAGLLIFDDWPADLGVNVGPQELADAVGAAIAEPTVDAIVVVYVPPVATPGLAHAAALREAVAGSEKPVVSTFLAVEGLVDQLSVPTPDGGAGRGSVPSFRTPERAVGALAAAVEYAQWRGRPVGQPIRPDRIDTAAARALVDTWRDDSAEEQPLADDELVALLACYGIDIAPFLLVDSREAAVAAAVALTEGPAAVGTGLVLKSREYDRRALAGVRTSLQSGEQVAVAYDVLSRLTGPWVYVQQMARPESIGVATVFGISADPSFGALVSFGLGGVATSLLDDRGYRAVPLTDSDAADLIDSPRAVPLLRGYGGAPVIAREPLIDLALRLSVLADEVPEVGNLTVRAVAGVGAVTATGASGVIGAAPARPDLRRRLR